MRVLVILLVVAAIGGYFQLRKPDAPALHPDDPRNATGDNRIVMLAADWCGYCRKQQKDFELANVRYRVIDIETPEGDRAMKALGRQGVPVTVIGQDVVQGYDTATLGARLKPLGYNVY